MSIHVHVHKHVYHTLRTLQCNVFIDIVYMSEICIIGEQELANLVVVQHRHSFSVIYTPSLSSTCSLRTCMHPQNLHNAVQRSQAYMYNMYMYVVCIDIYLLYASYTCKSPQNDQDYVLCVFNNSVTCTMYMYIQCTCTSTLSITM